VCCCVSERQLVHGCPPLAWRTTYRRYYGIVLGVGILVKYLVRGYDRREKNDKSLVLCVLCVVKNSYLIQ
jgi:hypothetical protein